MPMKNPPHPGLNIQEGWMPEGMTAHVAARRIGVDPDELLAVLDGKAPITYKLAERLEEAGWGRAEVWLRLQVAYNRAQGKQIGVASPSPRSNCYTNRICAYCHWWHRAQRDDPVISNREKQYGRCTRFPPAWTLRGVNDIWTHPRTGASDSCGEFKRAEDRYDREPPA